MKIYTKGGDRGLTSLSDGSRTRKDDSRIEVCGTLDELNAHIGLLISLLLHNDGTQLSDDVKNGHTLFLEQLQETLFSVGALVVSDKDPSLQHPVIVRNTMELEILIDRMDAELAGCGAVSCLPDGVQTCGKTDGCAVGPPRCSGDCFALYEQIVRLFLRPFALSEHSWR